MNFLNEAGDNLVLSLFSSQGKIKNWLIDTFGGNKNLSYPNSAFNYDKFIGDYTELARTHNYSQPNNNKECHHSFEKSTNCTVYKIKQGNFKVDGVLTPTNSKGACFVLSRNSIFPVSIPIKIVGIFDKNGDISFKKEQEYKYIVLISNTNDCWLLSKSDSPNNPKVVNKLINALHNNNYMVNIFNAEYINHGSICKSEKVVNVVNEPVNDNNVVNTEVNVNEKTVYDPLDHLFDNEDIFYYHKGKSNTHNCNSSSSESEDNKNEIVLSENYESSDNVESDYSESSNSEQEFYKKPKVNKKKKPNNK